MCGVSTRRVDQLVESLGLRISKSEVSRIAGLLDEQVQAFRERPLEGRYPYLFVDAKIEKVRDGGRVVNLASATVYSGSEHWLHYVASKGGLEALVFTGGVGEHSALVRRRAAERLGFLGGGSLVGDLVSAVAVVDEHHVALLG